VFCILQQIRRPWRPLGQCGAGAHAMAAYSGICEARDVLHWAMRITSHRRIRMEIEIASI
jgi:hypothetical protein